jgi:integrase
VLTTFLESRRPGTAQGTIRDYRITLGKASQKLGLEPTTQRINDSLKSLSCTLGGKYGYFKCIWAFYNWLYSPRSGYQFAPAGNPVTWVDAPNRPKRILPSLSAEQVKKLIEVASNPRDRAVIALFAESGLRLAELANIQLGDIDRGQCVIRTIGKGNKEGLAPFGRIAAGYLDVWLGHRKPGWSNIWGMNRWGIVSMLRRLEKVTGLPCNAHTFRRTFACLLRKAGVDTMTIKDLGRWESLEMVQRYTRSVSFQDSLKFYKAPLS